jgi:threonine/homoserine/homoserine lactone efflux protein
MFRTAGRPAAVTPSPPAAPGTARLLRQGFVTNVLNPKVALFFLALLPQFIDAGAADKTAAFLFLGAWAVLQGFVFLVAFVLLVAPFRRWQPRPGVVRGLHWAGGGLFALLAARLAFATQRP